ncbi:MAG: hypothetical protein KFB93_00285 [Simkaniaceae bacterium]|nr:MAG: hypothetical protein KFB93_00285 [Simkaniaceae bacterium]
MSFINELMSDNSLRTHAYDKIAEHSASQSSHVDATRKGVTWDLEPQIRPIPTLSRVERLDRMLVSNGSLDSDQKFIEWKIKRILQGHPELSFKAQDPASTATSMLQTEAIDQSA